MIKWWKIAKKVMLVSAVVVAIVFVAGIILSKVYEDEIEQFVISKIDKELSANIKVGEIEFSFIRKFPRASLRLKQVSVSKIDGQESDKFLSAEDIFLQFNINDIISKKYILRRIDIENGIIKPVIYDDGSNNLPGMKDTTGGSDFFVNIEKFNLENILLKYDNRHEKQVIQVLLHKMKAPMELSTSNSKFSLAGNMLIKEYSSEGVKLLENKDLKLDISLSIDNKNKIAQFSQSELEFANLPFSIKGKLSFGEKIDVDMSIDSEGIKIKDLTSILPESARKQVGFYEIDGDITFKSKIEGKLSEVEFPGISANFSLANAAVENKSTGIKLSNLKFSGSFNNGNHKKMSSATMKINELSGRFNAGSFNGNMLISNLIDPSVDAIINTELSLEELQSFAGLTNFDVFKGTAKLNLKVIGKVMESGKTNLAGLQISGDAQIMNGDIKLKAQEVGYKDVVASLVFDKKTVTVNGVNLKVDDSQMNGNFKIDNYMAIFMDETDKNVFFNGQIETNKISYDKIMKIISVESSGNSGNIYFGTIDFVASNFIYNDINMTNVKGRFTLADSKWKISGIHANALGGSVSGNMTFSPAGKKSILLTDVFLNNVDVNRLFRDFKNFDQQMITDKNIKGLVSGKISASMPFDANMNYLVNELVANADIQIDNGELIGVKELNSVAKYTRVDDFSHIKFSTLKNNISINNGKILIPDMEIKSDKMNLNIFGTHNFNNEFDYHLNVLLTEILAKKIEPAKVTEFGTEIDDGYGKTRIFLRIVGNTDDFKVSYDKKEAVGKVKADIKTEGQTLKAALREDFVNEKRDSLRVERKKQKEKDEQELKLRESGKFIIEIDEDSL